VIVNLQETPGSRRRYGYPEVVSIIMSNLMQQLGYPVGQGDSPPIEQLWPSPCP
jgi:hypothetical protein